MNAWAEDLLTAVGPDSSVDAVFARFSRAAMELGFEWCAYGAHFPLPVSNPRVLMRSNYPQEWQRRYAERNYFAVDPSVRHCLATNVPILWSDALFAEVPTLWDEARRHGLRFGWAQSAHGPGGCGMLTLARSAQPLERGELESIEIRMRWLVNIAHATLAPLLMHGPRRQDPIDLTLREREVLKWAADGKTQNDISEILCVSVDTVKFHTRNATFKLGAANTTSAVVRAAFLGLLH